MPSLLFGPNRLTISVSLFTIRNSIVAAPGKVDQSAAESGVAPMAYRGQQVGIEGLSEGQWEVGGAKSR